MQAINAGQAGPPEATQPALMPASAGRSARSGPASGAGLRLPRRGKGVSEQPVHEGLHTFDSGIDHSRANGEGHRDGLEHVAVADAQASFCGPADRLEQGGQQIGHTLGRTRLWMQRERDVVSVSGRRDGGELEGFHGLSRLRMRVRESRALPFMSPHAEMVIGNDTIKHSRSGLTLTRTGRSWSLRNERVAHRGRRRARATPTAVPSRSRQSRVRQAIRGTVNPWRSWPHTEATRCNC